MAAIHEVESPVTAPQLGGIDHVEWWVGNARAFAAFLASAFGFEPIGYAGPETGRTDRVSHLLAQGRVRFLVTGALSPDSPIAEHVRQHGDGVRDVCFLVDDAAAAYQAAIDRGARSERAPAVDEDEHGAIHHAAIRTYGETVHTFLDRSGYSGLFAPQFAESPLTVPLGPDVGLERVAGIELPWSALEDLGILVDRDQDGYLLQIFTETVCDRPTVFFEIIQREGAKGFGEGNFKALFESIERAQEARGNL